MKKFLIVLLLLISFAFAAPIASSQVRRTRHKRTFWKKHRDKLTVAGTTAAGAVVGGVVGGKKGALIGAEAVQELGPSTLIRSASDTVIADSNFLLTGRQRLGPW